MSSKSAAMNDEVIDVTEAWWEKLNELPFVSCKSNIDILLTSV